MKLIKNSGSDRVVDELRRCLAPQGSLDIVTPMLSLFAFGELQEPLTHLTKCRLVIPDLTTNDLALFGTEADRSYRNRLQTRRLMQQCIAWLEAKAEVRKVPSVIPQAALMVRDTAATFNRVITGHCSFTTEGLGITPGPPFSLIQAAESMEECALLGGWFAGLWQSLPASPESKQGLLARLRELTRHPAPSLIYFLMLYQVFKDLGDELDEERIVKSATGIRNTSVWKKLFKFQRDGVIGAIDKLERLGGCIIADSVGLGKTFEALAIIKYYELRNDRVLVLVPKRLRDNWTIYKANDRRNSLASDRLHYDVLNHTDL